jgi:hypothetical protein
MSSNPLGARSGPPGSRRGRAPKPLPPPPTGSATEQGEVPLTACDLYALTAGVGLPVMCGMLTLAEQATKLREALQLSSPRTASPPPDHRDPTRISRQSLSEGMGRSLLRPSGSVRRYAPNASRAESSAQPRGFPAAAR